MSEKQNRSAVIGIRIPREIKKELQCQAKSKGLSLSDFLIKAIEIGTESVKPKAESQAPEEATGRPDSQAKVELEEEEAREETEAPAEKQVVGPVDEEFLRTFKEEVKRKWPKVDFDSVMEELDMVLARHPEIKRTRGVIEKYFRPFGERGGS